ncbi:MAG: PilC/PilY family type IV pilus protein [Geobacteraceae bacterium]|nr:PilC/PilY family type IV pilus protein [Geobacteraceae bacterium]
MKTYTKTVVMSLLCMVFGYFLSANCAEAAVMTDYCNIPSFVSQSVPPLVLLTAGRDHKLYYEAFNEAMDLDEDGRVDIGYMHNIDYYGYFDSYKCYTYTSDTAGFTPVSTTADKFCTTGQWSGNILNWLAMSRMDVLRKVLYGGHRSTDTTSSTVLERAYIPGDAHSWAKEIPGGLCASGSVYKNSCNTSLDCDSGYTCIDKSVNLIGMPKADSSVCPATAVTWSSSTNGKIMVSQFWAQAGGAANGPTHADLLNSFYTDATNNTVSPLSLINMAASGNPAGTSSQVKYITNFNDAAVDPSNAQTAYTNLLAVTAFTTANNSNLTGLWQFAVDGDDGVEVEILPANKLPTNPANWIVANYYGGHGACFLPSATANPNNTALCNISQSSLNNGFFNSTYTGNVWTHKLTGCSAAIDTISGTSSDGYCVNGGIYLAKNTKYYMIVRQTNGVSQGGVKVWYRKPLDGPTAWTIFGADANLTLSSPTIAPGNECSIRYQTFVDTADTTTGANRQHLICSTNRSLTGPPVLRLLKNRIERKWNWASKERPDCADVIRKIDDSADIALSVDATKSDATKIWDYTIRDEVCKNISPDIRPIDKRDAAASGRETNCRAYTSGGTTIYKPAGLLQKYGEGDTTKVCSRTTSKVCATDSDCTNNASAVPPVFEGLCIDKAPMYFGLLSGSNLNNQNGGVLRKEIWGLSDEINMSTGQFIVPPSSSLADFTSTFPHGGIIPTFEALRDVGFSYSTNAYGDNSGANAGGACGWVETNPVGNGECYMWGNPVGEMMYEGLRYLAGKDTPTSTFASGTVTNVVQDGGLPLFNHPWGVVSGGNTYRPYGDKDDKFPIFPICSKPMMLVLSDENLSYDSDSVPGSKFSNYTEDTGLPKLNIDVSAMSDIIGGPKSNGGEGIDGSNVFIGDVNDGTTVSDFECSSKVATKFSEIRGLCPEEPTKQGSYYAAAVAYYGKTLLTKNTQQLNPDNTVKVTGKPNVSTYSVVLSSPVPKMNIRVNNKDVTLVPFGKSTSGGGVNNCSSKCSLNINALGSLEISGCSAAATDTVTGSFCPSNQIVDFYADTILYDNTNAPPYNALNPAPNIIYAKFRINFEDSEQGADHDMDAISTYEICTGATCSPALSDPNQVKVTVTSNYAAGGINQVMGFVISGTTEDAPFLVVRDSDSSTSCSTNPGSCGLPLAWTHTFTASSTGTTTSLLHSPLWYAAKWGGFNDSNAPIDPAALATYVPKPDLLGEWAKNDGVNPDNYYLVVNPLKLEQQLDKALTDILKRTSSGTSASILNSGEGSGATMLQAVFYPKKMYENQTSATWSGELFNLWYYVDPFLTRSTILEDTDTDHVLDTKDDKRIQFTLDSSAMQTNILRYNFDGTTELADSNGDVTGGLKTNWTAGKLLWKRDITIDPRTIYTTTDLQNLVPFDPVNAALLSPLLNAEGADAVAKTAFAGNVIDYVLGTDVCLDASSPCTNKSRNRTIDIKVSDSTIESHVWKLGDIVSSTPKIQGDMPLQLFDYPYPAGYGDTSYKPFYSKDTYKNRGMVYVGANDGMLHAFKLGKIAIADRGTQHATLSGTNLGREEWAYIPQNVLPYLKYLTLPDYDTNHLYLVDGAIKLFDVSTKTSAPRDDYWNEPKENTLGSNWKTVLLGGMGLGGASKAFNDTCVAGSSAGTCVKAPYDTSHGFSSYFALDVTDQDFYQDSANLLRTQPKLMWEFSDPRLGFSTSGPALVRLNSKETVAPFTPHKTNNGRWFAIYASGPTGPIDSITKQFQGKSDQNLRLFVVDLEKGPVVNSDPKKNGLWVIDTGIPNAFAGSISNNAVSDTEMAGGVKDDPNVYQDDVVYVGYTKEAADGTWTDGGVLRLVIPDSANPDVMWSSPTDASAWKTSKVVDGIGPVTTTVAKLFSTNNMYLFFGTGRYFYPQDDMTSTRRLFMVKEQCYPVKDAGGKTTKSDLIDACDASNPAITTVGLADLTSKTTPNTDTVANGWYIDLDPGERVVTDTVATRNGSIFYTTYKPNTDVCAYGGKSYLWGVNYATGGELPPSAKKGKVVIQTSTGSFAEVDLASALTDKDGRRTGEATPELSYGKASGDAGLFLTSAGLQPVKRILHIQERYK